MKKRRFSVEEKVRILREAEAGETAIVVANRHNISEQTFYRWKKKYGGMDASEIKRLKELEEENAKLKRMYADMALENSALKDLIVKKGW